MYVLFLVGMGILTLPVAVEEGTTTWQRLLTSVHWENAINILYQLYGWPSTLVAACMTLAWWFYYYPPRFLRHLVLGVRPMRGIPELELCQQELVKYLNVPYKHPIGNREIAATQEFLPHLKALCHILDEQDIPHPPLPDPKELTFTGTGKWGDFFSSLLAVRHDLEKARKVWQATSEFDSRP